MNGVITGAISIGAGVLMMSGTGLPAGASAAAVAGARLAGATTIASGAGSIFKTTTSAMGTYADKKNTPDQLKGQIANSNLRIQQNRVGYTFYNTTINYDNAEKIDNFFTLFGYAIKQLKYPNIAYTPKNKLRPHWNYIKNITTIILPKIGTSTIYVNEEVETKLKEIYNNGITFWMNGEEVGDYSLDNSPQE